MKARRLPGRNLVWAHAVRRYAARRLELAELRLPPRGFQNFSSFCELWCGRFEFSAQDSPADTERREQFLRFVRQCRSWEATLRISGRVRGVLAAAKAPAEGSIRGRMRRLAERHERISGFYTKLAEKTENGARAADLPWEVCEAYQMLNLPAGAPITEVRTSYRRLAIKFHPDRKGNASVMADLSRAYKSIVEYYQPRERQFL